MIDLVTKSISPLQFAFTKNCSTLQQMLILLTKLAPSQTDVTYTILVKHLILCLTASYSRSCGYLAITGTSWTWIKDYLTNHYIKVSVNNCYSNSLPVISGVPQGSILGPLLLLFSLTALSTIQHSQLKFADNTKCFHH